MNPLDKAKRDAHNVDTYTIAACTEKCNLLAPRESRFEYILVPQQNNLVVVKKNEMCQKSHDRTLGNNYVLDCIKEDKGDYLYFEDKLKWCCY